MHPESIAIARLVLEELEVEQGEVVDELVYGILLDRGDGRVEPNESAGFKFLDVLPEMLTLPLTVIVAEEEAMFTPVLFPVMVPPFIVKLLLLRSSTPKPVMEFPVLMVPPFIVKLPLMLMLTPTIVPPIVPAARVTLPVSVI